MLLIFSLGVHFCQALLKRASKCCYITKVWTCKSTASVQGHFGQGHGHLGCIGKAQTSRATDRSPQFRAPSHHGRLLRPQANGGDSFTPSQMAATLPQTRQPEASLSVPPATHSSPLPRASMETDCAQPCSMSPQIPHSGKGSLTALFSFLLSFDTNVTRLVVQRRRRWMF